MMLMGSVILLCGGGLCFWGGLWSGRRALQLGGGVLLGLMFVRMMDSGYIRVAVLPMVVGMTTLAWALATDRLSNPAVRSVGWFSYVLVVLLLGFRRFPGLESVPLLETDTRTFLFPPEKLILLGIVPPLVRVPVEPAGWRWGAEQPSAIFVRLLAITLLTLIPLAWLLGEVQPGWTTMPAATWIVELAYNLTFVCILEESFFRGIVQTALIRWMRQRCWPGADGLGLFGASALFGAVHLGGGVAFASLATLAGFSYGVTYYLTRRIHYAVLLHFAVNAVHLLAFVGPPTVS